MQKEFSDIKKLTREEARKPKLLKTTFSPSCNLIAKYNPLLPNLKTIIRNHLKKKCDICKNLLVVSPDFTCFATNRKYKIKGILECDSRNVIYLIFCKCCCKQHVGSATGFKEKLRIHKSYINTSKIRCGVANHLLNVCPSSASKFEYLQVQLIEKVSVQNDEDIDKVLWKREKYWQTQLFTLSHGLNNPNEWYALNRRGLQNNTFIDLLLSLI